MASNNAIWVNGLMSGTSMDGVDGAALLTDGVEIFQFGPSAYHPYSDAERAVLRSAMGAWPDDPRVAGVEEVIHAAHMAVLQQLPHADLIGFHGQTLAHDPTGRGTHQAGNGGRIAIEMNTDVVWDFRSNDVGFGGQGAPLAPIYHHAMARYAGVQNPIAILNLGGVGNVTWLDTALDPDAGLLAFDTGPANAPLDDFIFERTGAAFDADAALASKGIVNETIIERFLSEPFFADLPPKSLDRDAFARLRTDVQGLSTSDGAATLAYAMVAAVVKGTAHFPKPVSELWVTGGGRLNPFVMDGLQRKLSCDVIRIEDRGFDGDMVEAQAFAYLAARVNAGLPTSFPKTTGVSARVGGGVISRA